MARFPARSTRAKGRASPCRMDRSVSSRLDGCTTLASCQGMAVIASTCAHQCDPERVQLRCSDAGLHGGIVRYDASGCGFALHLDDGHAAKAIQARPSKNKDALVQQALHVGGMLCHRGPFGISHIDDEIGPMRAKVNEELRHCIAPPVR